MSDFAATWGLSRQRFEDEIAGLDVAQLNWRLYPEMPSIGEMALHVAGVEVSFVSQLLGLDLDEKARRLKSASTEGVVNENPFPYAPDEIDPATVAWALDYARGLVEPVIREAAPAVRSKQIVSALGPVIDGEGAFARLSFHCAYHQGQAYLIKNAPGFPR